MLYTCFLQDDDDGAGAASDVDDSGAVANENGLNCTAGGLDGESSFLLEKKFVDVVPCVDLKKLNGSFLVSGSLGFSIGIFVVADD